MYSQKRIQLVMGQPESWFSGSYGGVNHYVPSPRGRSSQWDQPQQNQSQARSKELAQPRTPLSQLDSWVADTQCGTQEITGHRKFTRT